MSIEDTKRMLRGADLENFYMWFLKNGTPAQKEKIKSLPDYAVETADHEIVTEDDWDWIFWEELMK